jgi:hypothetical protein
MKRVNGLFEQITGYTNIRLAFLQAIRGIRSSPGVIHFCRNAGANLAALREKLIALDCGWGGYRSFLITDPKLRVISTAPVEQRILHHAIINPLESLFERPMICHSYACRKGKGTHAAVRYAFKQCRARPYYLKLDIRGYFDSIDHGVLKTQLRRLIKDIRVIALLDGIIDSYETAPGRGVPIGNLTSQYFANLYLAGLDHFVLEKLRPAAYCRYMDDFALWAPSRAALQGMYAAISASVSGELRLALKPPVFGDTGAGLPFLGFLIKRGGIYLPQKSRRRVIERMAEIEASLQGGAITEAKAAERALSVFAAVSLARTNGLRKRVCEYGGGFRHEPRETRRVLEQRCAEPPFREPEQQRPVQPEQQPGLPAGSSLSPAEC